jgi:hypothetical protein
VPSSPLGLGRSEEAWLPRESEGGNLGPVLPLHLPANPLWLKSLGDQSAGGSKTVGDTGAVFGEGQKGVWRGERRLRGPGGGSGIECSRTGGAGRESPWVGPRQCGERGGGGGGDWGPRSISDHKGPGSWGPRC